MTRLEYEPTLDESADESFMQTIKNLIADICSVTSQIKKIAQPIAVDSTASISAITYQGMLCFVQLPKIFNSRWSSCNFF